jgi:hypothetical protein
MSNALFCFEGDHPNEAIPAGDVVWVRRWLVRRRRFLDDRVLDDLPVPIHAGCFDPDKHHRAHTHPYQRGTLPQSDPRS